MYDAVAKVPDFPAMERELLAFWAEHQIFRQLRDKNRGKPAWSFLDGPITANNPMGVHHAWGRSYKDMFQRYHAMNGRELRYQNGFDCQGLWVEVEVEKELGFATKSDILAHGIDTFVRRCKERVLTFAARQTAQSIRLGYWMDWDDPDTLLALRDALRDGKKEVTVTVASGLEVTDDPERIIAKLGSPEYGGSYFTFSTENNHTIWRFLKKCHDQGSVYRGMDVMPWCFRCGTGLSQMEVTEGRKITKHTSVFVRFPLLEREREALLVWTTTPWTLTSNVAAAVNPEMTYLKVRHGDWTLYLGKGNYERERIQNLEAAGQRETHKLHTLKTILGGSAETEILGEIAGSELVGLRYQGPFDHLPAQHRKGGLTPFSKADSEGPSGVDCHRVVAWSEVSDAEGTGIVHIAPGCGAEDHRLGGEEGLAAIAPLSETGEYLDGFGELTGQHVLAATDGIVADLKSRSVLVAKESYPHVYPHCWRCKSELVFRLVDEWFIRMDWRDRIQKVVPNIRWIPPDGEAREQDWLRNMGDWMISKKRFWGLALPIWTCEGESCDHFDVIGGEEELKARAVRGWEEFEGHTPHRPWIDAIELECGECGSTMRRVTDVGNPWLDAGIVPFSTVHYNSDPDYWAKWFPADFVVECFPGQFRNWFYSLLAMSAMLSDREPFRVLLGHALVRDARGHEMHKSAGNAIAFDDAAEILGAEVMRFLYASQNPVINLNFPDIGGEPSKSKSTIDGEVRSRLLTFWNCYSFFVTYAAADGWKPGGTAIPAAERSELDRWILSRTERLVAAAHGAFGDFALHRFMEKLAHFEDELSNWYLRRSRRRFWKSESDQDKESAYQTLYEVLTTQIRLLAPILPFLAEHVYQNLVRRVSPGEPESIHLCAYPAVTEQRIDEALETKLDCVIRAKNLGLSLRNKAKVRARQPLGKLTIRARDAADRAVLSDPHFATQVLEEVNIKELELIDDESSLVKVQVKADFKKLGPRLGGKMKAVAAAIASADVGNLRGKLESGSVTFDIGGEAVEILPDEITIHLEGADHLVVASEMGMFAALDTTMTSALERDGIARDFNRQAQDQRKALDLQVSDRIVVSFQASPRITAAIEEHRSFLEQELLADRIEVADDPVGTEVKIGSEPVHLLVARA